MNHKRTRVLTKHKSAKHTHIFLLAIVVVISILLISKKHDHVFAFTKNPTFTNLPDNTAYYLGKYSPAPLPNCDPAFVGSSGMVNGYGIADYSKMLYDGKNNQMMLWGGGHATTPRDDIDTLDLNVSPPVWRSAYPSTPILDMTPANYDATNTAWFSTNRPVSRHSYDLLSFNSVTGEMYMVSTNPSIYSTCIPASIRSVAYNVKSPVWRYSTASKLWSNDNTQVTWGTLGGSEVDPISGNVIIVDSTGVHMYNTATKVAQKIINIDVTVTPISYAQNLVYFPPTDKFYYMMNDGRVFELTLNRANPTSSTFIAMTGISGTLPPRPVASAANGYTDTGETGWVYDTQNKLIGGGLQSSVFYTFDPISKVWSASSLAKNNAPSGFVLGSIVGSHAIDYDSADNVYIFLSKESNPIATYEYHVWAYRYKGDVTPSTPTPDNTAPTTPTSLSATEASKTAINLSWNASTDNIAVSGYKVYRENVQIATTTTNTYQDTGRTTSVTYSYTVKAYDAAGNVSNASNVASVSIVANVSVGGSQGGGGSGGGGGGSGGGSIGNVVNNPISNYVAPIISVMKPTTEVSTKDGVEKQYHISNEQVGKGKTNDDVKSVQILLKKAGYYAIQPTGYFGEYTQASLASYQCTKKIKCSSNGQKINFDESTKQALYNDVQAIIESQVISTSTKVNSNITPNTTTVVNVVTNSAELAKYTRIMKSGVTGNDVKSIQNFLASDPRYGFKSTPNGKFGPATRQAVIKFQKLNKLIPTGIVGTVTYNKMKELSH